MFGPTRRAKYINGFIIGAIAAKLIVLALRYSAPSDSDAEQAAAQTPPVAPPSTWTTVASASSPTTRPSAANSLATTRPGPKVRAIRAAGKATAKDRLAKVQPSTGPTTNPAADVTTLNSALASAVENGVSRRSYQSSPVHGGAFANYPFEDVASDGVLIGFRIGLGKFFQNDTIKYIQPIYLTALGERRGKGYGAETSRMVTAKAPEGYAVGAARIGGGGGFDSITLTYMRINGTRLDPEDAYVTRRIGGPAGEVFIGGDGTPIIGMSGRVSEKRDWLGLGLVFLEPTPALKPH